MIIPPRAPYEGVASADKLWPALLDTLDPAALRALYATSRRLSRCVGRAEVYAALIGCVQLLVEGGVAIFAPGHHSGTLRLVASQQVADTTPIEISVPPQWLAMLYEHGAAVRSDSWVGATSPLALLSERMGYDRVVMALPLVGATRYYGLLTLAPLASRLSPGQEAALVALAGDGAQSLDRIDRMEESVWRDGEPGGSSRALAAVNAVTDIGLLYSNLIDQMLGAILAQILSALGLASGAILLYNEQSEELDLAVVQASADAGERGASLIALWQPALLDMSMAEARNAANHGQIALTSADDDVPVAASLRATEVSQLISVPLLAGGWLTGVLQVTTPPTEPIDHYQTQVLHILARQTAVAIENARLFAQTRNDQERTSAVVDATNDAILMLDERRRVMIINRRARFFFGISERELQEKGVEQLGALFGRIFQDAARFQAWLRQLLRSATERAVEEFRIIRPEARLLQCFSAPVMDVHDRYLGRILVFRDITREREVERMKSEFVSNVSHELRTPLTSIQGALQLVLGPSRGGRPGGDNGLSQRARDLLTISLNNTERLIRLINDILDIAKIEQGRIQMRREILDVERLCRSAAAEMSAFASNRGITIEIEVSPRMPKILADSDRSAQILVNLISNAIKFSVSGQRVLLSARHDGAAVCFSIRDWGRGIALEDQARLFQKFQQIDSSPTRDVGGTGLGLAISKALVEEQGGRIWLDSAPGKGSVFSFTLPVAAGTELAGDRSGVYRFVLLAGLGDLGDGLLTGLARSGWETQVVAAADVAAITAAAQARLPELLLLGLPDDPAAAMALLDGLAADEATRDVPLLAVGDLGGYERAGVALVAPGAAVEQIVDRALVVAATRQPHVLVVDDDPHVRPVLVRLLRRHGFRVTNVGDGFSALATIERIRPDVVLLDVKMPGIDGTEVLRRIKENPAMAATRVIILTANDLGDSLQAQVLSLGADGYLEKPITYERLISAVTSAIVSDEGVHE